MVFKVGAGPRWLDRGIDQLRRILLVEETGRHVRLMESYSECEIRLRDKFGGQNATFGLLGKIEKQFLRGGHLPPKGGGWSKGSRS